MKNSLKVFLLPTPPPNTLLLTLIVCLSKLTLRGSLWVFSLHNLFKTSLAAGWWRFGASGASLLRGAPCCASHSPGSLENRGSAAKHERGGGYRGPQEGCNWSGLLRGIGQNMQIENWLFKMVMFVFTLSSVPVRRIPTCCILLEVVTVLRKITRSKHKIGTSFKGTTHSGIKNVEHGYLIRNSVEPEFQTKRVSWARSHFQQPLSMR